MSTTNDREICSSRTLNVSVNTLYETFTNPVQLQKWWGPEGFTNTIHEFDLQPEGKWRLTMHGPEKGHYENSSVFIAVIPLKLIAWYRVSPPLFDMQVEFESISESKSKISFRMVFKSAEECEKIKAFVVPKNEENFDRLERVLMEIQRQ